MNAEDIKRWSSHVAINWEIIRGIPQDVINHGIGLFFCFRSGLVSVVKGFKTKAGKSFCLL